MYPFHSVNTYDELVLNQTTEYTPVYLLTFCINICKQKHIEAIYFEEFIFIFMKITKNA